VKHLLGNTLLVADQVFSLLLLAVLLAVREREIRMLTVCVRVCIRVPLAVHVHEKDA